MNKVEKAKQSKKVLNRLSRIEGQVRGVRRMIEAKEDCLNVVTQITAIKAALSMLGVEILKNAICLTEGKKVDEKYLKKIFEIK